MANFSYKALTIKDKIEESTISAKNREEAALLLHQMGLVPIKIASIKKERTSVFGPKISMLEKISFTRFMNLMLKAGLSISEGLDSLSSETENKALKKVLDELSYNLRSGKKISNVLERYPDVFDRIFINVTKAGEISGTLAESFGYLAEKLKSEYELKRQIKGAMLYPIFIFTALVIMGLVLTVFVLPKIGGVFRTLNIKLPFLTQILLDSGQFIQNNIVIIIPAVAGAVILGWFFLPRKMVKDLIMKILLHLPITKKIIQKIDYARLTRTLGVLLKSGVPITTSIEITLSTVAQEKIRNLSPSVKKELMEGSNLSKILKEHKIFPAFITQMLTVGEKSGTMEEVLVEVGSYYEQEVSDDLKNIAQIIEPVMILFVGVLVGLLVISIITPIYSLVGDLQIN